MNSPEPVRALGRPNGAAMMVRGESIRRFLSTGRDTWRELTADIRMMPDFLIVGAQKAGTTSVFNYLLKHPRIKAPLKKEVHYFDLNYGRGVGWYQSHFPVRWGHRASGSSLSESSVRMTGEASPYYLYHPAVPERVKALLPDVRIIILLRNPVERAFSHYQHERRHGREALSFEEAIEEEERRLGRFREEEWRLPEFRSFAHQRYSYLERGVYIRQLERWRNVFPDHQIFVGLSSDLFGRERSFVVRLLAFLELSPENYQHGEYAVHLSGRYHEEMSESVRLRLEDFYEPYNERLRVFLGREVNW